jgi:dTDP-4-dehydrorhamnose reductase
MNPAKEKPQLIIGASGLVGDHILQALHRSAIEAHGTYFSRPTEGLTPLDIRLFESIQKMVMDLKPSVVYLPAARANVDWCELHPAQAYQVNVIGALNVIKAANKVQSKVVYFSSDYIFDGKSGPYLEDDPPNPICEYGRQKLIAEHCIALHAKNYLIVRTTGVYGKETQGKNFIYRLVQNLGENEEIVVPVDQVGTPTYAPDLINAIFTLVERDKTGLYHISGSKTASRYEFALRAAQVFGLDDHLIKPVLTKDLGQSAPRPLKGGLLVHKVSKEIPFPLMDYKQGLQALAINFTTIGR